MWTITGGIVKKWGNEIRWCILLLRANKSWARDPARRRHHHGKAYRERIPSVNRHLGQPGRAVPPAGAGRAASTPGRRGGRVPRAGEIAAPGGGGRRGERARGLSHRAWEAAAVKPRSGPLHRAAAAGPRSGHRV